MIFDLPEDAVQVLREIMRNRDLESLGDALVMAIADERLISKFHGSVILAESPDGSTHRLHFK